MESLASGDAPSSGFNGESAFGLISWLFGCFFTSVGATRSAPDDEQRRTRQCELDLRPAFQCAVSWRHMSLFLKRETNQTSNASLRRVITAVSQRFGAWFCDLPTDMRHVGCVFTCWPVNWSLSGSCLCERRFRLGARQKLNSVYFNIAMGMAAVAGLLTQSALVFCIALALIVAANVHSGSIRTEQSGRRPRNTKSRRS